MGVRMRKGRPLDDSADSEWKVNYQIVVSKAYRTAILAVTHGSCIGIDKPYSKVLNHFY